MTKKSLLLLLSLAINVINCINGERSFRINNHEVTRDVWERLSQLPGTERTYASGKRVSVKEGEFGSGSNADLESTIEDNINNEVVSFRRHLPGGDFTIINQVLLPMDLPLQLEIKSKEITFEIPFIVIILLADILPDATCHRIQVLSYGDVIIQGSFADGFSNIGGVPMRKYEINVNVFGLQFDCDITLNVKVLSVIGQNATGLNDFRGFGVLNFKTVTGQLIQNINAYSPNFQTTVPVFAEPGSCQANPGELTYSGENLGNVLGLYDITPVVLDEIRNDPDLVANSVAEELCNLGNDIGTAIADILVQNLFTNTSSDFYIQDPFVVAADSTTGIIPALDAEFDLRNGGIVPGSDLFNLTDKDDFFVKILIPEEDGDEPIINTILSFLVRETEDGMEYDPFLLFLSDALGLNITDNGGNIVDLDLISVFNGEFFSEDPVVNPDASAVVEFNFSFVFDSLTVNVSITINKLLLDVHPPPIGTPILPNLKALSNFTLLIPGINLNDIELDAIMHLQFNVSNTGHPDNILLVKPFEFKITEDFFIALDWYGFVAKLALLFPLSTRDLFRLNFGPLLDNIFDCIISTFVLTPRVTGAKIAHTKVELDLGGFRDALFVVASDAVKVLLPIYQPIIPRGVELLAAEFLSNQEILDATVCPKADPAFDNWDLYPYNFSEGIFYNLSELADEDLFNQALEFVELEDNGINLIGNTDNDDGNEGLGEIGFFATLPQFQGYQQDLDFKLTNVRIEGLLPPSFQELKVLKLIRDSPYFPQELHNILRIGSGDNPLRAKAKLYLRTSEPRKVTDTQNAPPIQMYSQENDIDFEINFKDALFLLDLYFKYSQFDVDGQEIGNFINIDCWIGRLNFLGGVTQIDLNLDRPEIKLNCECNNRLLEEISAILVDPVHWSEVLEFINDILDRVANILKNKFSAEEWENTVTTSQYICENGESPEAPPEEPIGGYTEDITVVLIYLGLYGLSLFIPMLFTFCAGRYGPKLKKSHVKAEDDSNDGTHLTKSMATNPLIPRYVRFFVPVVLLVNIMLFVIGDTNSAVQINVIGHILNIPVTFDNFQTLSVISSVTALWNGGAVLLAILLFCLSIAWPYIKLAILLSVWFLPPRFLRLRFRGKIITLVDVLGRFSFAEFHFLVFVLVVFQIKGGSPNPAFLPTEDVFQLRLEIIPLISLFTFSLAVVVSILVSNALLVFQHNIENENRIQIRKKRLLLLEEARQQQGLTSHIIDEDKFSFRLTNWDFTVYDHSESPDGANEVVYNYTYHITPLATLSVAGLVVVTSAILVLAAVIKSIKIDIVGLVAYLIQFAEGDSSYELSVFELLVKALQAYKGEAVIYFVGTVFILTIAIIPILQTMLLFSMLFKSWSVNSGRKLIELHHIMTVWCCVDVFVVAVTLTVLELPTVAKGLVSSIEECAIIGDFMRDILLPLDLITEEDAAASCLALHSTITTGAYLAVLSVLVLNITNFSVSKLFHHYIEDRERVIDVSTQHQLDAEGDNKKFLHTEFKPFHRFLAKIGFIKLEDQVARAKRRMNDALQAQKINATVSSKNPLFEVDGKTVSGTSKAPQDTENPPPKPTPDSTAVVSHMLPTNQKVLEKRKEEETKLRKIDAQREFDLLLPARERLIRQLRSFFERVDPTKIHLVEKLVDEAVSRPDGMYRLNMKLMDKYGATISLDF